MTMSQPRPKPSQREFLAATAGTLALLASVRMARGGGRFSDQPEGSLTGRTLQQVSDLPR
jgi:hypothetical protein